MSTPTPLTDAERKRVYDNEKLFPESYDVAVAAWEFAERLAGLPGLAQHIRLCAHESELWELLAERHGRNYRLRVDPLGWRALCGM